MAESSVKESADLDAILAQLPIELRGNTLTKAVRAGGRVVVRKAKQLAPKGDPRHNPGKKALRDTITVITKKYQNGQIHMAVAGPSYPEGAHGHLVDQGHDVKVSRGERKGQAPLTGTARVEGKDFFAPAVDTTKAEQEEAVVSKIVKDIQKHGG